MEENQDSAVKDNSKGSSKSLQAITTEFLQERYAPKVFTGNDYLLFFF